MHDLAYASIVDLQKKLAAREISPTELLEFFIQRFAQYDHDLGSALEIFDHATIMKAAQGTGPLAGIPGIIKDNISQEGRRLTCASKILENFTALYDATAIARLKREGAFIIGRANMDEFAMGSSTETSAYKKTKNPWADDRVPGGSSGGSVAAVAAGLVPWALGSETGGSVRLPAAFCNVVGLKPTYGLISRYGLVAYGSSLDQIGIATRSAYDNALVLSAIAGHDPHDATSLPAQKKDYTATLDGRLPAGLRIGVIEGMLQAPGLDQTIARALESALTTFEKAGAVIKKIALPYMDYGAATYFIISRAEAASNLGRFDGVRYGLRKKNSGSLSDMYQATRGAGFGKEVRTRILVGNYVLSAGHAAQFYANAIKARQLMRQDFERAFKEVDVVLTPTHPMPAFKFGAFDVDKLQMDLQDYYTCPMSLIGIPALSIPCGFTQDSLPIGMQLVGPDLSEELLFKVAHAYQTVTDWHTRRPQGFE